MNPRFYFVIPEAELSEAIRDPETPMIMDPGQPLRGFRDDG